MASNSEQAHPAFGTHYDEDGNFVWPSGAMLTPAGVYFDSYGEQRYGRGPNRVREDGSISSATFAPDSEGKPAPPLVPTSHGWPTPPTGKGWYVPTTPSEAELDLMRPLHLGRKDANGNETSIALTGAEAKQADTFRACAAAEIAKKANPGSPDTAALVEHAIAMRTALEATYPNAGTYPKS